MDRSGRAHQQYLYDDGNVVCATLQDWKKEYPATCVLN